MRISGFVKRPADLVRGHGVHQASMETGTGGTAAALVDETRQLGEPSPARRGLRPERARSIGDHHPSARRQPRGGRLPSSSASPLPRPG
ncbi:hypothetical protein ACRAWF_38335 [Streptomyces sp. L7]